MSIKKKVVAFIPARAGSKGVLRKNVRIVAGRPLIEHTIVCALETSEISDVVVTTNCVETRNIAARFPVMLIDRPDRLSDDETPTFPVIEHALRVYEESHDCPDVILLLQCTSPMRQPSHITKALDVFESTSANSVISVVEVGDEHPARMYFLNEGKLCSLYPDQERVRRQDLPPLYRRNGAIYAIRRDEMLRLRSLIGVDAVPFVMSTNVSVNIDTEIDLQLADVMMTKASTAND